MQMQGIQNNTPVNNNNNNNINVTTPANTTA